MTDYFEVYGRKDCRYCDLAKALLTLRNKDWRYLDVEGVPMFRTEMMQRVDHSVTTVPQIFHNGIHVGGYTDLQEYLK